MTSHATRDRRYGTAARPALSMNIGPTRLARRVRSRLAEQPPPLYDDAFLIAYGECLRRMRVVLDAAGATVFVIPGTGTSALEAAAANLIPAGSTVTVASTGQWGDRWAAICERLGLRTYVVVATPGEAADLATLERFLTDQDSGVLLATHVDSSSGVRTDLAPLQEIAHRHGAMLLVDGVCAAGAETVRQNANRVDVYITSTPKALSAPAGLSILSLLPAATAQLATRNWPCVNYSQDLQSWLPVMQSMENGRFAYFQTPPSNLILAFAEALELITDEGITNRVARHRRLRDQLHDGLNTLGIDQLVTDPELRANGVTVCWYPADHEAGFLNQVREAGVLLPAGTHPVRGVSTFRLGHLGNVTEDDITRTLTALEEAIHAPGGGKP